MSAPASTFWPTAQAYSSQDSNSPTSTALDRAAKWPTATAEDAESTGHRNLPGAGTTLNAAGRDLWQTPGTDSFRGRGGERQDEPGLDREARELWATPRASEDRSGKVSPATMAANSRPLTEQAETAWPTPKAQDANGAMSDEKHARQKQEGHGASELNREAILWPTPTAEPYGTSQGGTNASRPSGHTPSLENMAREMWPTATAGTGTGYQTGTKGDVWRPTLEGAVLGKLPSRSGRPAVPPTPNGPRCARCRQRTLRRLQPVFVAWLMGLPECLISDGPWGTPWFRWGSRMRSEFSRLVSGW